MQLSEIQKRFRDTMLSPPSALGALSADTAALFEAGDIPLPERLKVYRNNIIGNIGNATMTSFPLLEKLVGHDFLRGLIRAFIMAHPPAEGCLNDYGAGLDEFIAGFEPARGLPYLPDVARLEIAINRAYHAADDRALGTAALAAVPEDALADLALRPRDSVQLVSSRFPLDRIRAFCQKDSAGDETLDIGSGGTQLLVHRPALRVEVTMLAADDFAMLAALRAGRTLGAALETVLATHPAFDVQKFLQTQISLRTLRALS